MWLNPQAPVDLVTFIEKALIGKLHSFCSAGDLFGTLSISMKELFYENS